VAGNNSQLRYEIGDKGCFEELQLHPLLAKRGEGPMNEQA
jgi:hypothetical protein